MCEGWFIQRGTNNDAEKHGDCLVLMSVHLMKKPISVYLFKLTKTYPVNFIFIVPEGKCVLRRGLRYKKNMVKYMNISSDNRKLKVCLAIH